MSEPATPNGAPMTPEDWKKLKETADQAYRDTMAQVPAKQRRRRPRKEVDDEMGFAE